MTVEVRMGDLKELRSETVRCLVCGEPGMDFSLTNGAAVHRSCVDELTNSLAATDPKRYPTKTPHELLVDELEQLKAEAHSFTGFFKGVFAGRDYAKEIAQQQRHVDVSHAQEVANQPAASNALLNKKEKFALQTEIWDFWPDYPPDWDDRRRRLIEERGGRCEQCRSDRRLQAHHKTPFWKGGSNKSENLELLCVGCHGDEHGRDFERDGFSGQQTVVSDKEELIAAAMKDGSKITFIYKKFDPRAGKLESRGSRRTIRPASFKNVESGRREGFTRCVKGHCDLRNEDRVFAVHRMYKVQRVN